MPPPPAESGGGGVLLRGHRRPRRVRSLALVAATAVLLVMVSALLLVGRSMSPGRNTGSAPLPPPKHALGAGWMMRAAPFSGQTDAAAADSTPPSPSPTTAPPALTRRPPQRPQQLPPPPPPAAKTTHAPPAAKTEKTQPPKPAATRPSAQEPAHSPSTASSSSTGSTLPGEAWLLRGRRTAMCHQACLRVNNTGLIYFLHMRKAGGTSLAQVIRLRTAADGSHTVGAIGSREFSARLLDAVINIMGYPPAKPVELVTVPQLKEMLIAPFGAVGYDLLPTGPRPLSSHVLEAQYQLTERVEDEMQANTLFRRLLAGGAKAAAGISEARGLTRAASPKSSTRRPMAKYPLDRGVDTSGNEVHRWMRNVMLPPLPYTHDTPIRGVNSGIAYYWDEGGLFTPGMLGDTSFPQVFLTHLREPVARILSNYKMLVRGINVKPLKESLGEWVSEVAAKESSKAKSAEMEIQRTKQLLELEASNGWRSPEVRMRTIQRNRLMPQLAWTVVRNYYIRRLVMHGFAQHMDCARAARMLGGNVTRDDLELAKRILAQFDVVFITDDSLGTPEEEAIFDEAIGPLSYNLGQNLPGDLLDTFHDIVAARARGPPPAPTGAALLPKDPVVMKVAEFHYRTAENENAMVGSTTRRKLEDDMGLDNATVLAQLREWNKLDTELFEFAKQLVHERAAAGAASHFLPRRGSGSGGDTGSTGASVRSLLEELDLGDDERVPDWCNFDAAKDEATCTFDWSQAPLPGGPAVMQTNWTELDPKNNRCTPLAI